jgi:gas vesicle protein
MENSNNNGKLVGALLVGAAIGGVLGILFAPDKGSVTRKKIVGKSEDLADAVKDKFNEFMELARKEADMVKEKASDFLKDGAAKVEKSRVN